MCEERLALFDRYNSLVMEHAQRVSDFSTLAGQNIGDQLGKALTEVDISRQAVQEARQQLKRHTVDHGCDHVGVG